MYGRGPARLRALDGVGLRPPFHRLWTWHGGALLEFPPVVAGGRLFIATFDGRMYAIDARTGLARWRFDTHRCAWASPAIAGPLVVETFIGHTCGADVPGRDGEVIAFSRRTGAIRWRRTIGPTESSPLVARDLVYVADWSGRVLALNARTGRTRWAYRAGGAIKGSPTLAGNRLYIGSYDGHVYAIGARNGRLVWRASGQPRLGRAGSFYSTPAAAYDRVYIGSTDGKVYSFGAGSGRLRWSISTGGYVYAAPAVWRGLVLVGSYDHTFRALDAATGAERWSFRGNGPISGAASVVDGVVYFSDIRPPHLCVGGHDRASDLDVAGWRILSGCDRRPQALPHGPRQALCPGPIAALRLVDHAQQLELGERRGRAPGSKARATDQLVGRSRRVGHDLVDPCRRACERGRVGRRRRARSRSHPARQPHR